MTNPLPSGVYTSGLFRELNADLLGLFQPESGSLFQSGIKFELPEDFFRSSPVTTYKDCKSAYRKWRFHRTRAGQDLGDFAVPSP